MTQHKSWTWKAPKDGWDKIAHPMRPSGDDLDFRREAIAAWCAEYGVPRVLIMGVTPEYLHLPWPEGTHVLALDRSREMIDSVWEGPRQNAVSGDWTAMPLHAACRDLVLCDGGLSLVTYPVGLAATAAELSRIVVPGGLAIFRLYVPPEKQETPAQIIEAALAGQVADNTELSILLWGAMVDRRTMRYKAGESLTAMEAHGIDPRELYRRCGWNPDHVNGIEEMRKGDIWLNLPTVEQVAAAFAPGFELESVRIPSYRLGERFPTAIFRRR